jgi:uncharacterized membrane protein
MFDKPTTCNKAIVLIGTVSLNDVNRTIIGVYQLSINVLRSEDILLIAGRIKFGDWI